MCIECRGWFCLLCVLTRTKSHHHAYSQSATSLLHVLLASNAIASNAVIHTSDVATVFQEMSRGFTILFAARGVKPRFNVFFSGLLFPLWTPPISGGSRWQLLSCHHISGVSISVTQQGNALDTLGCSSSGVVQQQTVVYVWSTLLIDALQLRPLSVVMTSSLCMQRC